MFENSLEIGNWKLEIAFVALLFFLCAPKASAFTLTAPPNYLELSNGLVGYWTFDGKNMVNNVADSSGNGNNGDMVGFTSTSSAVVNGKVGQALKFNGATSYVLIAPNSIFDVPSITVSSWFKTSNQGVLQDIVREDTVTRHWGLRVNSSNQLECFTIYGGVPIADSLTTVTNGKWHFASCIFAKSGSNTIVSLYLDGIFQAQATATALNPSTPAQIVIGAWYQNPALFEFFPGQIDDVRIYNRALSATEVAQLYNMGAGSHVAVSPAYSLTSGLVGYWTFDGKNMLNNVADSSGQGNNGNLVGFTSTSSAVVPGKVGQALKFKGFKNRVTATGPILGSTLSISMWLYPTCNTTACSTNNYHSLVTDGAGGNGLYYMQTGNLDLYNGSAQSSQTVPLNKWTHVAVSCNAGQCTYYVNAIADSNKITSGSFNFTVGGIGGDTYSNIGEGFGGTIDDVRVYNRALSATEVEQLYKMGSGSHVAVSPTYSLTSGLVGYWTFDGKNMINNVADSSGQGNTGYLQNFTSTSSAVVRGKVGQALQFNGALSGNAVNIPNLTWTPTSFSASWWTYPQVALGSYPQFIEAVNGWGAFVCHMTNDVPTGDMYCGTDISTRFNTTDLPAGTATLNKWQHFVYTYNGTQGRFYKNGVLIAGPKTQTAPTAWGGLNIGGINTAYSLHGSLDDVRIYNRALSASEVQQLYNLGR